LKIILLNHLTHPKSPESEALPPPQAHLPLHSSGLGKIGVSRSRGVRQRLQLMQGALAEALQCLAPGGVMVISILDVGMGCFCFE